MTIELQDWQSLEEISPKLATGEVIYMAYQKEFKAPYSYVSDSKETYKNFHPELALVIFVSRDEIRAINKTGLPIDSNQMRVSLRGNERFTKIVFPALEWS